MALSVPPPPLINQQGVIHSPEADEEGLVVRAKCTKEGLPNPDRIYAMKILTNYFQVETQSQVRTYILCALSLVYLYMTV